MFRLVMLACLFVAADACDMCVSGVCQQRREILRGFAVTDQMAFDHRSRVLYLQLEHNLNTVVDFPDFRIERVQHLNTSGLTVDQNSSSLYTAHNKTLYQVQPAYIPMDSPRADYTLDIAFTYDELDQEPDLMFYKNNLFYTTKCCKGLYLIEERNLSFPSTSWLEFGVLGPLDEVERQGRKSIYLANYTITDFVVNKNDTIYFVSDDMLYAYQRTWDHDPEIIAFKRYVLSVDKFGDVYLGDVTTNVIYKLDEYNRKDEYAAYTVGSIDRFVFDHENNIVFHDAADGTVSQWKPEGTKCVIVPPHDKFGITNVSNLCDQQ